MRQEWLCFVLGLFMAGSALAQPSAVANGPSRPALSREAVGAAFLSRIRFADPDYQLVLMACLKGNQLNLLLSRHATANDIPILVKGLLTQLSQQIPGEDLSVIAFRPIIPLRETGVARLDARTGQISYADWSNIQPAPRR